jgi:hypothetical protein
MSYIGRAYRSRTFRTSFDLIRASPRSGLDRHSIWGIGTRQQNLDTQELLRDASYPIISDRKIL